MPGFISEDSKRFSVIHSSNMAKHTSDINSNKSNVKYNKTHTLSSHIITNLFQTSFFWQLVLIINMYAHCFRIVFPPLTYLPISKYSVNMKKLTQSWEAEVPSLLDKPMVCHLEIGNFYFNDASIIND